MDHLGREGRLIAESRAGSRALLALALVCAVGLVACNGGGGDEDAGGGGNGDTGEMTDTGGMDAGDGGDAGSQFEAFDESCTMTTGPGADAEATTTNLLKAFVGVESGGTICMVDGTYKVNRELSVNANGVTVLGQSQEGTVLDFSGQEQGANGILAQVEKNFAARNFTIKNTAGDALKAKGTDGVVMKNVTVTWDAGKSEENGAYALYPVQAKNVLIEGCEVKYARDAGVYLGQSETAIIRNNVAVENVVGIEVENTFRAEVHGNEAYGNTNGVLIINLPDLEVKGGGDNLIYNNEVYDNNAKNFGEAGTAVSNMPQGSGIILATSNNNEIRENTIKNNQSVGIGLVTWKLIESNIDDEEYDPYPEGNWIHDNTLKGNGSDPQGAAQIAGQNEDGSAPQIFWDGKFDKTQDNSDGSLTNCFGNNETPGGDPVEMELIKASNQCPDDTSAEGASFCENDCSHEAVEPVELPERVTKMAE